MYLTDGHFGRSCSDSQNLWVSDTGKNNKSKPLISQIVVSLVWNVRLRNWPEESDPEQIYFAQHLGLKK